MVAPGWTMTRLDNGGRTEVAGLACTLGVSEITACDLLRRAIGQGTRICVHGDYDVDGICATALAVLVLRELGARVDWHLPSRFEEGYGVSRETLARLAREGYG